VHDLLERSTASWSCVADSFSFWNIVRRTSLTDKGSDSIAERAKLVTESVHSRILFWAADLVKIEGLCGWLEKSPEFGSVDDHGVRTVLEDNNWSEGTKDMEFVLKASIVHGEGREHLGCSLRMSSVRDFALSGFSNYMVYLGNRVIVTKFKETVIEKLGSLFIWVDVVVLPAIGRSSVVSKPDVKTSSCKDESWRVLGVHDPPFGAGEQAVLKEDSWSSTPCPLQF
jgi:hypothetical protein